MNKYLGYLKRKDVCLKLKPRGRKRGLVMQWKGMGLLKLAVEGRMQGKQLVQLGWGNLACAMGASETGGSEMPSKLKRIMGKTYN